MLVRAYPRSWRERYGDEVLAWVEEGGLGPARALNLLRGALDARLHPELVGEGSIRMVERLRGSVLGVLVAVAVLWFAGTLALLAWRAPSTPPPTGRMSSAAEVSGWLASLLLAATVGVPATVTAVRRSELGLGLLRFGAAAVAVVAAAMLVMLGATVWWGLALRSADPALFHSHEGVRASSTVASWVVIVALMAASTALALRAGARGLTATRGGLAATRRASG